MQEVILGVLTALFTSIIIGVFNIIFLEPYREQTEIYKKIIKIIANYRDPREYKNPLRCGNIMEKIILEQTKAIDEVTEMIEVRRELGMYIFWILGTKKIYISLCHLYEYIRNPIMLEEQKMFKDTIVLDFNEDSKLIKRKIKIEKFYYFVILILVISIIAFLFFGFLYGLLY